MDIVLKLLVVVSVVALLRSSEQFRTMSREVDESVMLALKRFMHAAEESGIPPEVVPFLLVITVLTFMFLVATTPGVR